MKLSNTIMINEKLLPTGKKAFTLAEVLITLSILGVVAALTIPTLVNRQSDLAAQTKISKAISAFEDFAAIYMAETGEDSLKSFQVSALGDYFKKVNTGATDGDFTTADGVAWHFETAACAAPNAAKQCLTGYATATDATGSSARYAVGMWATNNVVNAVGTTDGVANVVVPVSPATLYTKASGSTENSALISGRKLVPATEWLKGTKSCTGDATFSNNAPKCGS